LTFRRRADTPKDALARKLEHDEAVRLPFAFQHVGRAAARQAALAAAPLRYENR
jgi:hypothetical protein